MVLQILVIGALMGMLGQGARAVVGLKSMSDDAKALDLSPNDLFQAARLLTSFLIGMLVGLASVLVYLQSGGSMTDNPTWQTMLAWAVSAYAGTDFLESFISQYLSPGATSAAKIQNATVEAFKAVLRTHAMAKITRSTLQGLLIKALETSDFTPDMKTVIATTYPPDGLFHVWRQCVREDTPSPFIPYGLGDNETGLSLATVQAVTPAPKTLGDFEQKCIEPWFAQHGYQVDTAH